MKLNNKKKILFVSHDATRTGAPIILLNFLEWLNRGKKYELSILLKSGGGLTSNFEKVGTTYKINHNHSFFNRITQKIVNTLLKPNPVSKTTLPKKLKKQHFDLIYLNTVLSLDLAFELKQVFGCPVIAHIHENEYSTNFLTLMGLMPPSLEAIDHFIAVSQSTKDNLIQNHKIAPDKISLIYAFIPIDEQKRITKSKTDVLEELKFKDKFIIGGAGVCSWRKGTDLFIQLAVILKKLRPDNDIKLIWVGNYDLEFKCQYQYELKKLNIIDKVIFTGSQDIPKNYFQVFDVFVLTSREDPFPLVALEAASMGKPVVFFESAGGMPELFVDEKGGLKVAFGDVEEMAKAILFLHDNPEQIKNKSYEAAKLVQQNDINIAAKQIITVIDRVINKNFST